MLMITPDSHLLFRTELGSSIYRQAAKVTLAGTAATIERPRKLGTAREKQILETIVDILKTGRNSKFEYQATARNGLRRTLVLEGWKFSDAERSANTLVDHGLERIGAVRPTFLQAQPDYTYEGLIVREHCRNCNRRIPEHRMLGGLTKYCCEECGNRFRDRIRYIDHERMTKAEYLASCVTRSAKTLEERSGVCVQCGTFFESKRRGAKFCSIECSIVPKHPVRDCDGCRRPFKPKLATTRFCSNLCSARSRTTSLSDRYSKACQPLRTCETCGTGFKPRDRQNRFCCFECRVDSQRVERAETVCGHCSSVFRQKRPSEPRLFCSRSCAVRARGTALSASPGFRCEPIAK
jgi:hypothetical protein